MVDNFFLFQYVLCWHHNLLQQQLENFRFFEKHSIHMSNIICVSPNARQVLAAISFYFICLHRERGNPFTMNMDILIKNFAILKTVHDSHHMVIYKFVLRLVVSGYLFSLLFSIYFRSIWPYYANEQLIAIQSL